MKKTTFRISHKIMLNIIFVSLFISISIMTAALILSGKGKTMVLKDVTAKLQDLQVTTEKEFNKAQKIASEGVVAASGIEAIGNVTAVTLDQQQKYHNVVNQEIGMVADNVTQTLKKQNHTTNETLDNLLSVSTDSMNRIMEFDNGSLEILSSMALFNVHNIKTISAEGLKRLNEEMEIIDNLLWKMQEDSLDDIDNLWSDVFLNYAPYTTEREKEQIRNLQIKFEKLRHNIEIRQRNVFEKFLEEFRLQSEIIAEEMRLLTDKVSFAINQEIENSAVIQDENIDKVITDLLLEKIKISDNITESSVQVKKTINNLQKRLLLILDERGRKTQKNILAQTLGTRNLAEKTKEKVSLNIRENTSEALGKIDETIHESNRLIEDVLQSSSNKTIELSVFITLLCISVAVLMSYFIVRSITEPISNVLTFADKMAKGDLSERLPEGSDEMGEMGRALNVMADELVKLQEATLNSFNQTLDQVIDCVYMFDPETLKFIYVNQGACLQVGYSREELLQMTPLDIKPEFSIKSFEKLIAPLKDGTLESQTFTTVHRSKTEKNVPVEVLLKYVIPPGNDPRFIAIVRDITERQEAKKERERMQTQLLQAQKLESVGQLAAGIAHEINTPIQFVGTNIEFLADAYEDISGMVGTIKVVKKDAPEEIKEQLDQAIEDGDWEYVNEEIPKAIEQSRQGVDRVTTIVSAMKNFSHPGSKEMMENDLNAIIENTIIVASNEWKYVADMEKDLDPELPKVPCLADEMGQVFLNLIVNAVHAIRTKLEDRQESGKGKITIHTSQKDSSVVVTLRDNGCGIPEKSRNRIFDPFYTTKEVGKGTGQGLAITHDVITQKHKGKISFESEEGEGTSFVITLPVKTSIPLTS